MHKHSADEDRDSLRPKAARLDEEVPDHYGRAAVAGRTDVLGSKALLDLQRVAGNAGVTSMLEEERSPVHDVISSGGRPLDAPVRTDMEQRMGHDFGDVRIHDDSAAAASARAVNAHAYTVGSNIVFQRERYDPGSAEGRTTLAHELTHVVQQRSGPVDGTSAPGGIQLSDPSDRFEREAAANADRVVAGPMTPAATSATTGPAVQRQEDGETEEEPVQGLFVQREGEEEEEEPVQGLFVQREGEEEEEEPPAP
jgi:Domain of unknown function (DUF4157)